MSIVGAGFAASHDEAIEELFTDQGFDGIWSLTTKLSILAIAGRGLPVYLNYLWVMTPQTYRCPVCQRAKPELIENTNGKVLAQLCLDHDHIIDYINQVAKGLQLAIDLKPLYDSYMSFCPTIICNSCNTVDSSIKAKQKTIDEFFTFTPAQKAQLYKPYKRSSHWVYQKKSLQIWEEEKALFFVKKSTIPTSLQDYIGSKAAPYHYKRYIDDDIKAKFAESSPLRGADAFHAFVKRSTANGVIVI